MPANFIKELRDAAMGCSNIFYRKVLKEQSDRIEEYLELLAHEPNDDNMRNLLGAWIRSKKILHEMPPEGTPAPPISDKIEPRVDRIAA